jgi:hypothetical protein
MSCAKSWEITPMANGSAIKVINSSSARSTVSTDTTPARATGDELSVALARMEQVSETFAQTIIKDPAARADYTAKTRAARSEIIQLVKEGKVTPHEAAKTANAIRNQIMELTRAKLTDFGLSLSKDMKQAGRPLEYMERRKALEMFGREFEALAQADKERVWLKVVESAGKSNRAVNVGVGVVGVAGKCFLVATLALAVYHVYTSDDVARESTKEGLTIAAGAGGSALGAMGVVAVVSNPAGWLVGVVMFVGAAVGAASTSATFDYFWPENIR